MIQSTDIEAFRAALSGIALIRGDGDYDQARSAWNGEIDRYPAVIARCSDANDVAVAIGFARRRDLEISVRGGFHNTAGTAICDGGVMIDLSALRQVEVDSAARRVRVGGGATLGDLDIATQAHGLAVPAGIVSHTGVGGLALGGGMGWLTPLYGLTADNLVSAEVVTADGRRLRAAADENQDLFWALRGGGGNFGVVTEFEFRLHPVGPVVHLGLFFWSLDQGTEALKLGRQVFATLPQNANAMIIGVNAPPAPFVPEQHQGTPGYALAVVGFGSAEEHAGVLAPIRAALPPLFEFVTPMPYTQLQQMFDEGTSWGVNCYEKALYLDELSDDAIVVITKHQADKTSPLSLLELYRLDAAYAEVGEDETAFGGKRSNRIGVFIVALTGDSQLLAAERAWVRTFWEALRPHAEGAGSYINAMVEIDEDRVRASYGPAKYERLARIKAEYDPDNVFHLNANIKPALQPT
ncbi:MAG: FAD-binding oxidoreductase [Actinomycetota bacterium]|nr:FAD-binding oxidoreductase [Actinomycetota bacterium]